MTLTPLLVLVIAVIALVVALCAAVRLFNLEHVDLSANILKLVTFSFRAKSRPQQEKPKAAPARPRGGRRRKRPGTRSTPASVPGGCSVMPALSGVPVMNAAGLSAACWFRQMLVRKGNG